MTRYNPSFELTVEDVDLIETALHQSKDVLSQRQLARDHMARIEEGGGHQEQACQCGERVNQIQDLLGRLHNQKVFFRPSNEVYVGG